ncbi:EAL domain-containing response regulator [Nautilia lithotrophica]
MYDIEMINELKKLNLLFVDDNETIIELGKALFSKLFKSIKIASNGKEASEILKNNNIDIVITDINMPKINGFELAKQIKKNHPDIIVVFLSAFFDTDTLLKAIDLDIDGFLLKPFDLSKFFSTMKNILSYKIELQKQINLLQQYKNIVDESLIVSKTDLNGIITYVNDAFVEISGFKREELIGQPHNIVRHPDMKKEVFKDLWNTILNKKTWKGLIKNRKKNGEAYYVETIVKPIFDNNGNIKEFIALRKDVTNYINAEKLINDKLQLLKEALLVLIKIDNFHNIKLIYDEDTIVKLKIRLLKRVKNLLKKYFKNIEEYDIQEGIFGFLIEKFSKESLNDIFNKIVKNVLNYPIIINGFEYYPLIKISYAYGKTHLYENAISGFDEIENSEKRVILANGLCAKKKVEILKNMEILKTIKYALKHNKVISLFQPIIDNSTKKIIKYESLVRIINESGDILTPYHFLEIAKQAGLYSNITIKVLENTFKIFQDKQIPISINLSPSDILIESIRNQIYSLLERFEPEKGMITFELLEDEIIQFEHTMTEFIKKVTALNAEIAIDDFGSGYSNFTRIIEAKADIIKIDGILIKDIDKDKTKQDIVEAIVNFAKKENKKTVAEFVENEEIFNTIKKLKVDYSQGYYFSKPLLSMEIKSGL